MTFWLDELIKDYYHVMSNLMAFYLFISFCVDALMDEAKNLGKWFHVDQKVV